MISPLPAWLWGGETGPMKAVMASLAGLVLGGAVGSANDGVFYAEGNTLVAARETVVELRREVLRLKRAGRDMEVVVDFTFFNPGPPKTELVGFVTPPAEGDVTAEEQDHPQVSGFTVQVNGEALQAEVTRLAGSGFRVGDRHGQGHDFVYHFEVPFRRGENSIRHSYTYRGGGSVETVHDFSYRLTTGTTWANGEIGDFTLEIDLGRGAFFAVPASFHGDGRPAPWEALGDSRLSAVQEAPSGGRQRMFAQRDGLLRLKSAAFRPERDLTLTRYHPHLEMRYWVDDPSEWPEELGQVDSLLLPPAQPDGEALAELDAGTLRFLRNYPYARKGHAFRNKELRELFGSFLWYDPQPGVEVKLSPEEAAYVARVKRAE